MLRCFPLDCSGLPLDLPHRSNRLPVVCDPGFHPGSPFEVFPAISAVPHIHSGRRWKALHDNASVRAFFGSPHRARARASHRIQLPGLSTCLPGAEAFRSDHRSGLSWSRPLSPLQVHFALSGPPHSTGDCSSAACFAPGTALRTRSTSGSSSVMGSLVFDHVSVDEHSVILPWASFLLADRARTVCTCPSHGPRSRGPPLEPAVDHSSPDRARPRSSPEALLDLPTISFLQGFP